MACGTAGGTAGQITEKRVTLETTQLVSVMMGVLVPPLVRRVAPGPICFALSCRKDPLLTLPFWQCMENGRRVLLHLLMTLISQTHHVFGSFHVFLCIRRFRIDTQGHFKASNTLLHLSKTNQPTCSPLYGIRTLHRVLCRRPQSWGPTQWLPCNSAMPR